MERRTVYKSASTTMLGQPIDMGPDSGSGSGIGLGLHCPPQGGPLQRCDHISPADVSNLSISSGLLRQNAEMETLQMPYGGSSAEHRAPHVGYGYLSADQKNLSMTDNENRCSSDTSMASTSAATTVATSFDNSDYLDVDMKTLYPDRSLEYHAPASNAVRLRPVHGAAPSQLQQQQQHNILSGGSQLPQLDFKLNPTEFSSEAIFSAAANAAAANNKENDDRTESKVHDRGKPLAAVQSHVSGPRLPLQPVNTNVSSSSAASYPVNTSIDTLKPSDLESDPSNSMSSSMSTPRGPGDGAASFEYDEPTGETSETLQEDFSMTAPPEVIEDDWVKQSLLPAKFKKPVMNRILEHFTDELEWGDSSMVVEYSDDIFGYMKSLEAQCMPDPEYMKHQSEIGWPMRSTLIDWLLQVHMRYHMLPETLWIAVNIVDRFLSMRVVSLIKLQLVGVTAMFIAAKYEEVMAPSVDEFVYMTESGYTRDEILRGERIILKSLDFNISTYCSPYSWVRRISKADDYDVQTRTLSKFLMEITLLDHRFIRASPSYIAAVGMFLSRVMLGGDWSEPFIVYSGFLQRELIVPARFILATLVDQDFPSQFVYKKYANRKFLRASAYARNWALSKAQERPEFRNL